MCAVKEMNYDVKMVMSGEREAGVGGGQGRAFLGAACGLTPEG